MNPQPGEVWLADLGLSAKTRPVVIVSRQDPDPPRALILYVPLTTQRRDSPYEVQLPRLPFLDHESVANVQGLGSLPSARLERKLGRLSTPTMDRLKEALVFALDLKPRSE
jgi:mRNA interferase MazF